MDHAGAEARATEARPVAAGGDLHAQIAALESELTITTSILRNVFGALDEMVWTYDPRDRKVAILGRDDAGTDERRERAAKAMTPEGRELMARAVADLLSGRASHVDVDHETDPALGEVRHSRTRLQVAEIVDGYPIVLGVSTDVTDLVAMRRAAEQRESRFKDVATAAGEVFFETDANGRLSYLSERAEELYGLPTAEVLGRRAWDFVHPEDQAQILDIVHRFVPDGVQAELVEHRIVQPGGAIRWVRATAVPVFDGDGNPIGSRGTVRDITDARQAELHKQAVDELLRETGALARVGGWRLTVDGELSWTDEVFRIHDLEGAAQPTVEEAIAFYPGKAGERVAAAVEAALAHGEPFDFELPIHTAAGRTRQVRSMGRPGYEGDRIVEIRGALQDVTELAAVRAAANELAEVVNASTDFVFILDVDGTIRSTNRAGSELLGGQLRAVTHVRDLLSPADAVSFEGEVLLAIAARGSWQGEVTYQISGREPLPVSQLVIGHLDGDGVTDHLSIVARDISDRKATEAKLEELAFRDPLTGLANRSLFFDRLERSLARARRTGEQLGLLFVDIDHFKVVNDSLGHEVGDRLLAVVADRIEHAVRASDTPARFGGDEFVVLCEPVRDNHDAMRIANRLLIAMQEPISLDGRELRMTVSVGAAVLDADQTAADLLRDADTAVYRAKELGRSRAVLFDGELRDRVQSRLEVTQELHQAIERDEFHLQYQAVVAADGSRITGVEALLRWQHPTRGRLYPGAFLPIAEDTNLIVPIGERVLEMACTHLRGWGTPEIHLAVNVAAEQLIRPDFVASVERTLDRTGLPPARLCLEITETALMSDVDYASITLGALRQLGVGVAIDDFGTGYSSLSYLRRFPATIVKLDRSFLEGIETDVEARTIAASVVDLATALGLEVVAEGVETEQQVRVLRELGCHHLQGFLFHRPIDPPAVGELLGVDDAAAGTRSHVA